MNQKGPVSVLIAPLNWGLGHATRCIPIIKELIRQGSLVTIAASGPQKNLLKQEFPQLEFVEIPGYEISYRHGVLLKWALLFRIPALLNQIKKENKWLEEILQNRKMDTVISDNRYGLYHKKTYCVFMTHQLYIQSGWEPNESVGGWRLAVGRWVDEKIMKWNYRFIRKFSVCWVPDQPGNFSIAGKLSQPPIPPPVQLKYIGILSRFKRTEINGVKDILFILLSGPEPQRTRFENILFSQLSDFHMQTIVVRGLPGADLPIPFIRERVKIYNHLPAGELYELLKTSEYIIARSGYSTIMDLVQIKKNAILVPTPGQTEQEYLGYYMHKMKWMYMVPQKKFNLEKALLGFQKTKMKLPDVRDSELHDAVKGLLKKISGESR
jgi:UDP:flavonoid glycosyltransferase YjiC (YdhE family)